jgi:hypothetical protein
MKIITATLLLGASSLMAQRGEVQPTTTAVAQIAGTLGSVPDWGAVTIGGRGGALVTGSPVSAKEVRKTVQTLSDGTVLENTSTTLFYRDSQGRTRTDETTPNGTVLIQDPVAGLRITLMPGTKTARQANAPALAAALREGASWVTTTSQLEPHAGKKSAQTRKNTNSENLGLQNQNGVMAEGTRTTVTIPQGQIGNNRDIRVVNERWYSKDLQMMVKSINSDPRFGVTSYEMTNISLAAPDPMLFKIPTGYTITEGGGRGRGKQ